MDDGYHEDWPRRDAEQIVSGGRHCECCPDPDACDAERACIRALEISERPEREPGARC